MATVMIDLHDHRNYNCRLACRGFCDVASAKLWVTISQYAIWLALEFENQAIDNPSKHRGLSS
jgi:hypothetical protein